MKLLLFFYVLFAIPVLAGCSNDLNFKIEYDDGQGLKKGDSVIYGSESIGSVSNIDYTDQGTVMVDVTIMEKYRDLAKQSTLFYVSDSDNSDAKVIELAAGQTGPDTPINEDQVIHGDAKADGLAQKLQNQFGQALLSFSENMQNQWDEWKSETMDKQLNYMEKELDRILKDIKNLSKSARDHIKTELLPMINQQIEALRNKLEALGREDELDPIDKKMEQVEDYIEA